MGTPPPTAPETTLTTIDLELSENISKQLIQNQALGEF